MDGGDLSDSARPQSQPEFAVGLSFGTGGLLITRQVMKRYLKLMLEILEVDVPIGLPK